MMQFSKSRIIRIDSYLASYFAKTLYFMAELFQNENTQPFYLLKFVKDTFSFYISHEFLYVSLDTVESSKNMLKKFSIICSNYPEVMYFR